MMTEPSVSSFLGLKYGTIIAGLIGAVISLQFLLNLSVTGRVTAVLTGAVAAHYLTPLTMHWLGLLPQVENGIAFLIGLSAMNLIPGLITLSSQFRSDPLSVIRRPKNQRKTDK